MVANRITLSVVCLTALGLTTVLGCQTLHEAGVPGLDPYIKVDPAVARKENSMREKYVVHHDHDAFYWLLSHKIGNGMQVREVEDILGEEGEQTSDFSKTKNNSDALYQVTDTAYKWGPDSKGNSAVLFFRDGKVVNYHQDDYVENEAEFSFE